MKRVRPGPPPTRASLAMASGGEPASLLRPRPDRNEQERQHDG